MIGLFSFFIRCFVFTFAVVLAIGTAYDIAIRTDNFPKPPPDWVKFVNDAKNTAQGLSKTADDLKATATALVEPLKGSLDLAQKVVDKFPKLPDTPSLGGPPGPPPIPAPPNAPAPPTNAPAARGAAAIIMGVPPPIAFGTPRF